MESVVGPEQPGTTESRQLTEGSGQPVIGSRNASGDRQLYVAEIKEPPRLTSSYVKLIVQKYDTDSNSKALIRDGKAMLFLENDSISRELKYGDWIIVFTNLKRIKDASNPYGFDPAYYYGQQGVFYQGWVASDGWTHTLVPYHTSLTGIAFKLRDRLLQILRNNSLGGEEFAIASALLLGYTGEIGQDLKRGFAASGAMHILSVSGMHVGIIYLFLDTILAFLNRREHGPKIKGFLLILMIWTYSLITGLSPPVFRAALMISLVILGRTMYRKPDSMNVLAGSMFIILLYDPALLFNIGFQFSYLAVIGILLLYKPVFNLLPFSGWIVTRVWGLIAVSIVAQLTTFPLTLYAFHQFPNYFILTNILVLPLASLVIYSGIGVLALSPFQVISSFLAKGLSFIVWLLDSVIRSVEALPGSVTAGIYPSLIEALILYALIIVICCFFAFRKAFWMYAFFLLILIWSFLGIFRDYRLADRNLFAVFQVRGASQYVMMKGRNAVCLKDFNAACRVPYAQEVLSNWTEAEGIDWLQTTYLSEGDLLKGGLQNFQILFRKGDFLQFSDQRMVIVSSVIPPAMKGTLHADLVIVRKDPDIEINTIARIFTPHQIVIDPSNSWYKSRRWKEQAEKVGIPCHSVLEEGAFVWAQSRVN